jgi:nucleoside-specific outer membrane channel protein Tsx
VSIGQSVVGIGRRVVLLLAAALIVATMAVITAGPASADDNQSDSHLRHQINVIQNRPGPVTNQERNHIQNLRERIHDNNEDNNDD